MHCLSLNPGRITILLQTLLGGDEHDLRPHGQVNHCISVTIDLICSLFCDDYLCYIHSLCEHGAATNDCLVAGTVRWGWAWPKATWTGNFVISFVFLSIVIWYLFIVCCGLVVPHMLGGQGLFQCMGLNPLRLWRKSTCVNSFQVPKQSPQLGGTVLDLID